MIRLMQAVPGSGKSTIAGRLAREFVEQEGAMKYADIYSADDYHLDAAGNYNWKFENAAAAHAWCFRCFMETLEGSSEDTKPKNTLLIVDNTNTQLWEIAPYLTVGEYYGHEVIVTRVLCDLEVAIARQIHNVPEKTIRAMHARLAKPLPFWKYEEIDNNPR